MREVKFRAWIIKPTDDADGMYYTNPADPHDFRLIDINFIDGFIDVEIDYYETELGDSAHDQMFDLDDIVLMEYTNFKDKNDKEIYEGDILKHSFRLNKYVGLKTSKKEYFRGGHLYIVEFGARGMDIGFFVREVYGEKGDYKIGNFTSDGMITAASECTVIGNIYENPELLK